MRWECNRPSAYTNWEAEIQQIESFIAPIDLVNFGAIKIDECTTVNDPAKFTSVTLEICRHNKGVATFDPYLSRLKKFVQAVEIEVQTG